MSGFQMAGNGSYYTSVKEPINVKTYNKFELKVMLWIVISPGVISSPVSTSERGMAMTGDSITLLE